MAPDKARSRIWIYWIFGILLTLGLLAGHGLGWRGSGQLHTLMEATATLLALIVGVMALVRFYSKKDNTFLFVGTGFIGTAFLDGYHAIVTSAFFAQFLPSDLPSLIPWSWVASRMFLSLSLYLSLLAWKREDRLGEAGKIPEKWVYWGSGILTLVSFLFFAFVPLPRAYYPEIFFHRPEEFVPALFFLLALIGYLRQGKWRNFVFEHWLVLTLIVSFLGQAVFMSHSGRLFDYEFDIAHLLKKTSYIFVLTGLTVNMYHLFRQADESAERIGAVVDNIIDAIITIDEKGIIQSANPGAESIFGFTVQELIGENVRILAAEPYGSEHDGYIANYHRTGIAKIIGKPRELVGKKKGGDTFPMDLTVTELRVNNERLFVGIVRDITEMKRNEEALRISSEMADEANKAKSDFLANMSHELRTPLNAIIGFSEMLEEEAEDLELVQFSDDLKKIKGAGHHLLQLINDILDLSKIEAGKMNFDLSQVNIHQLLSEVQSLAEPLINRNNNTLHTEFAPNLGTMHADETKIRQVLFNLVSNAAKFTENGQITLKCQRMELAGEDFIEIVVEDTGIGIPQGQIGKLFAEFSQADTSATRKFGGTGLGLAISRNFTRMMGGDISVRSEEGQGSTFTVRLPADVSKYVGQYKTGGMLSSYEVGASGDGADKPLVLVVDDEPNMAELMERILTKNGFRMAWAKNGYEGLEKARELRPDAIALDVMMNGLDGWGVLTQLKSDPQVAKIPVIMCTIIDEKSRGLEMGAAAYLTKPIDREQLLAILEPLKEGRETLKVLVVEDDPEVRQMLNKHLRMAGCTVQEAENGRVGIETCREAAPDLILLDLMMPEMNGFEFMAELRKDEKLKGTPVVVITAMDLSEEDLKRLNGDVICVLNKQDYDTNQLIAEVKRITGKI